MAGSTVTGSVNALLRRLRSAVRPLSAIVRGDLAYRGERSITTSRAQVTVVDLHNLPDRAQRFAVGVTLRGEFARKERQGTARPLMFVIRPIDDSPDTPPSPVPVITTTLTTGHTPATGPRTAEGEAREHRYVPRHGSGHPVSPDETTTVTSQSPSQPHVSASDLTDPPSEEGRPSGPGTT